LSEGTCEKWDMKAGEVYEESYKHSELAAAAVRNCRAKTGDFYREAGNRIPAGKVIIGSTGAVTTRCDIEGFGFREVLDFVPNATVEVDGERVPVVARIVDGVIQKGFFARREGGFYTDNRKVTGRRDALEQGCHGHAKDWRKI
jgi:hypothetical protein